MVLMSAQYVILLAVKTSKQKGSNHGKAARIWFSSSEAEDDETEFDTQDPAELIALFLEFAEENGIMNKKLKIRNIEYVEVL